MSYRHGRALGLVSVLVAWLWLDGPIELARRARAQEPADALNAEPAPAPPPPAEEPPVVPAASAAPPPAPVQSVKTTQDAALLSPPPPPGTHVVTEQTRGATSGRAGPDGARDPMGDFGFTLRLGYASVASGDMTNPTYNRSLAAYAAMLPPETLEGTGLLGGGACTPIEEKCRTSGRNGFQLALALDTGGGGFGFALEPYITIGGNAFAVGMYLGPRVEIHLVKGLYLGLGLGARAAYVSLDHWKHGGDIFGRIPVNVTYYVVPNFALVLQGSFGAGISLFVSEPVRITDPRTNRPLATAPKIAVGAARGFDLTIGLRFP